MNKQNLPLIPSNKGSATACFAKAPHNNELAAKHQDAMKIIILSQMDANTTTPDPPRDFTEDSWKAMFQRNAGLQH